MCIKKVTFSYDCQYKVVISVMHPKLQFIQSYTFNYMNTDPPNKINRYKQISILKLLTAFSFLIIVDPLIDPGIYSKPLTFIDYFTGIQIADGLRQAMYLKGQVFILQDILLVIYCLPVIYLIFFPYSGTRRIVVIDLIALCVLCIPALMLTAVAMGTGFIKFIPTLITIVLFWALAIVSINLVWKQLMAIKGKHGQISA